MKKCPFCAESIQDEAIKCRYCGARIDGRGGAGRSLLSPWWATVITLVGLWVSYYIMEGANSQVQTNAALRGPSDIDGFVLVLMRVVFYGVPLGFWVLAHFKWGR